MSLMTPEQIADKKLVRQEHGGYTLYESNATTFNTPEHDAGLVRRAMIAAINTDRAQHEAAEGL